MGILVWAILGLIAGAIARAIYPGHQGLGILGTMVLGIIGAIVGGFVASLFGASTGAALTIPSVIVAVIGALITLFIYYAVTKRTV